MQNFRTDGALTWAFILFSFISNAQLNYDTGYLIKLNGEKITGLLKDQRFEKLSQGIYFKASHKAEKRYYKPEEILGFGFNDGDEFESHPIQYTNADGQEVRLHRFLNILMNGKITLYELSDLDNPFFIKKEGGSLQLLCYREELVKSKTKGKKHIKRNGEIYRLYPEYIDILTREMADCIEVNVDSKLPLKRSALLKLVGKYNKYKSPEIYKAQVENARNPKGRVTLYGSMPYRYYPNYGGIGKGLMMEMGGQHLSFNFGVEHVSGDRINDSPQYHMTSFTLRGNYRPLSRKIISPYGFVGWNLLRFTHNAQDDVFQFKGKSINTIELGLGADVYLTKHFYIKAEVSYPHFPNFRLGAGFMLK